LKLTTRVTLTDRYRKNNWNTMKLLNWSTCVPLMQRKRRLSFLRQSIRSVIVVFWVIGVADFHHSIISRNRIKLDDEVLQGYLNDLAMIRKNQA